MRALLAALFACGLVVVWGAQPLAQSAALAEARRLRDGGNLDAALQVLRKHVKANPDDGEGLRLLAQTLYWRKQIAEARAAYDRALARRPRDAELRVEYARMLVEVGDRRAARRVLAPVLGPNAAAPALALLGTLAYWEGDLTTAERLFVEVLRLDPSHAEARRQLQEIRAAAAPWLRLSPTIAHDDQPLDRRAAEIEVGGWLSPLTPLRVRVVTATHDSDALTTRTWVTEAEVRHYIPAARLELETAGGFLRRSAAADDGPEWLGRAGLGVRLPQQVTLRGRLERSPYLSTVASLRSRILVDTAAAELHWNSARGWLAQAAVARQRYPDANTTAVRYAWILAPLVRTPGADLQAGYAAAYEHAADSRFVPAEAAPDPVTSAIAGRYDPYYTPANVMRHSVAAALRLRAAPRATFRANGSYGVRATEDVPQLFTVGGIVERFFFEREFHPWEGRATLDIAATPRTAVSLVGEAGRGAFYRWRALSITLTHRFVPEPATSATR